MGAEGAPLVGGIFQAGGALMEADDRAKMLNEEAYAADKNAKAAIEDSQYNAERQQMIANQTFGEIRTGYAASGTEAGSADSIAVLRNSHINAELDRLNIIHAGEVEAEGFRDRASAARAGARRAKRVGQFNAFSALFGAGAKAASYGDSGGGSGLRQSSRGSYGSAGTSSTNTGAIA